VARREISSRHSGMREAQTQSRGSGFDATHRPE
jgi:hypothetical protein